MLDCGDGASGCEIWASFDQEPPVPLRACFADGPYPPFQGLKFDASRALVEGLKRSRSADFEIPVVNDRTSVRVRFRFDAEPLVFDARHRREVCEGDFAGDHGAPDR